MKQNSTNLVSSAKVFVENKYAEFTTLFRVPFKEMPYEEVYTERDRWRKVLQAWALVCIDALEARMDSCVAMLFRNKERILISNECQIVFKKNNGQLHSFNHLSFQAMEEMVKLFKNNDWESIRNHKIGISQLQKALYWIKEEDKKDHNNWGFGQLISCLEELAL